jgi:hypothetical protein
MEALSKSNADIEAVALNLNRLRPAAVEFDILNKSFAKLLALS